MRAAFEKWAQRVRSGRTAINRDGRFAVATLRRRIQLEEPWRRRRLPPRSGWGRATGL